ncbi:MAG: superoxide dismutase [Elusimicrobia bacterium]|nr:superoxide dismutase [Elusimicrobiota bacterium]
MRSRLTWERWLKGKTGNRSDRRGIRLFERLEEGRSCPAAGRLEDPTEPDRINSNEASEVPMNGKYQVRHELRPKALEGFSEEQTAQHWALYEGYVKNANLLIEKIAGLSSKRDFGPEFAELKRRLGFEVNGIVLHEHYFSVLKAGQAPLGDFAELTKMFKKVFGGFSAWKEEFQAVGKMRGVGWVILYYDPHSRILANYWITLHEEGHPAGFVPILVMDVWEHAYMIDHGASGRAEYIDAFFRNVDWPRIELNLKVAMKLSEKESAHSSR